VLAQLLVPKRHRARVRANFFPLSSSCFACRLSISHIHHHPPQFPTSFHQNEHRVTYNYNQNALTPHKNRWLCRRVLNILDNRLECPVPSSGLRNMIWPAVQVAKPEYVVTSGKTVGYLRVSLKAVFIFLKCSLISPGLL